MSIRQFGMHNNVQGHSHANCIECVIRLLTAAVRSEGTTEASSRPWRVFPGSFMLPRTVCGPRHGAEWPVVQRQPGLSSNVALWDVGRGTLVLTLM